MVVRNGVSDRLQQHCLTRLWLCYDKRTLSLTNRGKEVDNTVRFCIVAISREVKLLAWEEWGKLLKLLTVTNDIWLKAIDKLDVYQWEVLFTLLWWADCATYGIARLKAKELNL